jgi:hypothetical protein
MPYLKVYVLLEKFKSSFLGDYDFVPTLDFILFTELEWLGLSYH